MGLLAELKRRNVIRMTGLYLVGAWLIVQVAGTLLPMFDAPAWVARTIVVVLALAFVPTMIFSWVYELTPEGLKRDAEVPPEQSIARETGRRIDRAIIAVLGLALAYFAVDRVWLEPGRLAKARAEGAAAPAAADKEADRSIVVLPFTDMSQDKDQEYLSDGLAEELLNLLARVPQLRVISRSSAFSFKGKNLDVPTIAKQLDVAHVLEGSVRKAGNQVRITVQLIDARHDAHLWSETYDRPLENIFAIQDEIAAAVVQQLRITLLGAAPTTTVANPEAYALWLEAREFSRLGSADGYARATALLQKALQLDPGYAQAYESLSWIYLNEASRGSRDVDEGTRLAREAANRALALDPELAAAEADLGYIAAAHDLDLAASVRHIERALALDPNATRVRVVTNLVARTLGRKEMTLAMLQREVALDPANPNTFAQLGKGYAYAGRSAEAIASYRRAIELSPGYSGVRHWLAIVLLLEPRDRARAEEALALAKDDPGESYRLETQAMAYHALGRKAESDAAIAELHRRFEGSASYNIAYVHVFRGEVDQAFAAIDVATRKVDAGLTEILLQPAFEPIKSDPRWRQAMHKLGRDPEQLAAIKFEPKVPWLDAPAGSTAR